MIKSLTAKEIVKRLPSVKQQLWGGALWSSGYFITTVGKHGSEQVIQNYVRSQGGAYQKGHQQQGSLFDEGSE
jgi:putative transposase